LQKKVVDLIPGECELVKAEHEGPDVVIYLKNISAFYKDENLIKKIAGTLRKRVLVRSDPSSLMPPDKALEKIKQIIPAEAGVTDIKFFPDFCEAAIDSMKPGLVIGKGGSTLKEIIFQTGWAPKILRTPTMPSKTIKGIRESLFNESDNRKKFLSTLGKKISTSPDVKCDWVKITALGGFREVGRMCILVQTPNDKILLDCGVNPETAEGQRAFPYLNSMGITLDEIDALVISHAHLDHSGFIPYLYAYGFDGPVYTTAPTRDLMALLQFDYIKVLARTNVDPPYNEKHVRKMLNRCVVRDYNDVTDITPETKLTFHNAGHILGSAMTHLHIGEGLHNLVFTGDIKYGFTKLFEPASTSFPRVETLIMESTYGGRNDITPPRQEAEKQLMIEIMKTLEGGGKVLIPVFSVGRAQETMLVLEEYAQANPDFNYPVYLDGMILEASAIHTAYPEFLRQNLQRRILSNNSPFESKIFEIAKNNRKDIVEGDPCVILAPSGMLSGGPSVEYLKLLADNPKNLLIFVGYQSALSLGRKIQRGSSTVPMLGEDGKLETVTMKMRVETIEGFSGHSDRTQLMSFAKNLKPTPERVFTLHGDETKCEELSRTINKMLHIETRAPMNLDAIRLK